MKDRLMLVVAVVAGLVATVLAFVYISSATATLDDVAPAATIEILFTKDDLAANSAINSALDLRSEKINVEENPVLARSAVRASDMDAVNERTVSSPIPAGVPLLYSYLTQVQDVNLAPGSRAMAISVNRENLMGGLLVPGDRVDLIVTYQKEKEKEPAAEISADAGSDFGLGNMMSQVMGQLGQGGSSVPSMWVSEEVLSNIRIIAVGTALTGSRQAQMFGMAGGNSGGGSTITLELTVPQALELIRVQANGKNPLTVLLRPEDTTPEAATSTLLGN